MKQASEAFFVGDGEGNETLVPKGKVFADNHPIAVNAPDHFEDLDLDEPKGKDEKKDEKPKPQPQQQRRN